MEIIGIIDFLWILCFIFCEITIQGTHRPEKLPYRMWYTYNNYWCVFCFNVRDSLKKVPTKIYLVIIFRTDTVTLLEYRISI